MLTKDDFIRMAKEAGFDVDNDNIVWCDFGTYDDELIKFAALVATHIEEQIGIKMLFDMVQAVEDEREAIIGLLKGIDQTECESKDGYWETSFGATFGKDILSAIRARGKNT